jgi:hypothetical protein
MSYPDRTDQTCECTRPSPELSGDCGSREVSHDSAPGRDTPPRRAASKNVSTTWFLRFRRWHAWGGLVLSCLIVLVGVTGILLNHKDLIFQEHAKRTTGVLRTTTVAASLAVDFDRALAIVRDHCGDVSLDKIELKDENGRLVYKVGFGVGREWRVDAYTGDVATKYGHSLSGSGPGRIQWEKIVNDLHTGKIVGITGKLLIDITSVALIGLSLTGVYLWGYPLLRKRRKPQRVST